MLVVVSYDISTEDAAGRRRLRQVAKACQDYGQRVQYSIFECEVAPATWVQLRSRLIDIMDPERDSLRFYFLGSEGKRRIEHQGAKKPLDLTDTLIL